MHAPPYPSPCHRFLALLLVVLAFGSPALQAAEDPLTAGRRLASTRFDGWTYGSNASKKQVDCVQFVLAVVEECVQASLIAEIRKAILIDHGWSEEETQQLAAKGVDPRLGGVAYALPTLLKKGRSIPASDAKPGDLIQYWMKQSDGTWFGHSGVISSVKNGRAKIFGAHKSANRIADSSFELNLAGGNRHLFLVRLP